MDNSCYLCSTKQKYYMKNYLLILLTLVAATSCTKYNITGSSDMQELDGRTLFLKAVVDGEIRNIDSCDVVHGKFQFSQHLDSTCVVTLSVDDTPVIPVVLEEGKIEIEINKQRQIAKGTPLNDTLTSFNKKYEQLVMQMQELSHTQSQAIMNGEDMNEVNRQLAEKEQLLVIQEDRLISDFISSNFDNCLGSYVFQLATSAYEFPMLTPWIEALMTKATDTFKNDPYVKEYMQVAQQNQDIMTGVAEPGQVVNHPANVPAPTLDATAPMQQGTPPTPNQMAAPAEEE